MDKEKLVGDRKYHALMRSTLQSQILSNKLRLEFHVKEIEIIDKKLLDVDEECKKNG